MTKFIVTEKKSLEKNTVDNSQIILKAAAIVQVNLHRKDVAEFIQNGNNLILKLQNGDIITIENFFVQYEDKLVSDLVFEDNECAFLWFDWNNGAPLFKEISGLESLLPIASGASSGALWPWVAGGAAIVGGVALAGGGGSGGGNSNNATPNNKVPQVLDIDKEQPISVVEDKPKTGTIVNVTDPDGDDLTYTVSSNPSHGTVTIDPATGAYTYTPAANYNGNDSFVVTVADGKGGSTTVTVPVTVTAVNDAPVAQAITATGAEDSIIAVSLSGTDVDGTVVSFKLSTLPANGSFYSNAAGTGIALTTTDVITASTNGATIYFKPNADWNGNTNFQYSATDNNGLVSSSTATGTITVTAVNDAPTATASSISTDEDTPVNGSVVGQDVDGDSLTYSVSGNPSHGTVTIDPATGAYTYTPAANYNGNDSFEVKVDDGKGGSTTVTVPITVTAVNDAPTATASSISTDEDTPVNGNVVGQDVDNDSLTYSVSGNPSHGTVTIDPTTGAYTYTPATNYNGNDSFVVTVADGKGGSTTVTVPVSVAVVNNAPTATASSISTDEDTPINGNVVGQDVDNDSLTYTVNSNPSHGTVTIDPATGAYTYTPDTNYNGNDSFDVQLDDGKGGITIVTIPVTIVAVNDAPVPQAITATGVEDSIIAVSLSGTDVDGTVASFKLSTLPANGSFYSDAAGTGTALTTTDVITASSNGATIYFKPNADWNGNTNFQYSATDNNGLVSSSTATGTITVTAVNDAPVPQAITATGAEDSIIAVSLSGTDVDGTVASFKLSTLPANGNFYSNAAGTGTALTTTDVITASSNGATIYFKPNADWNGNTNFQYYRTPIS
ncbi:Ig-like domain-containing protein [Acinetobacter ihumii]|uniref:Ig-like domain-containing protein n=1 Tax=Acinetobacter ihumii TaxID=2483802 RepID=UPI0013EF5818|nr:Ig-like domain-containing protein [Acinetobacter ihumii]